MRDISPVAVHALHLTEKALEALDAAELHASAAYVQAAIDCLLGLGADVASPDDLP